METPQRPQIDPRQLRKQLLTWGIGAAVLVVVFTVGLDNIWREGIIRPMLNSLLFLYANLGHSFVLAIAAFTVILRLITLPLSVKQVRSTRRVAAIQPLMNELQKKYGGNKERLVQEQQRLYKEAGASPLSGCLPTLIQFPIWIGLYQSISSVLADTPIELMRMGQNIYANIASFAQVIPLQSRFLWLNLALPDPSPVVLPILVGGTMYLQQKLATKSSAAADPQQASMNNTMQLMMPLMFAYFTTQFASGLALYFIISNVVGIALQWGIERYEDRRGDAGLALAALQTAPATSKDKVSHGTKRQRRKKKR